MVTSRRQDRDSAANVAAGMKQGNPPEAMFTEWVADISSTPTYSRLEFDVKGVVVRKKTFPFPLLLGFIPYYSAGNAMPISRLSAAEAARHGIGPDELAAIKRSFIG